MATKRSAWRSARSITSISSGISPNQTTCGRNAPARPQSGQACQTVRSSSQGRTASQRPQRAFKSSPCMWMTPLEPARSCRSSMFWVTIVEIPAALGELAFEPRERKMRCVGLRAKQVPTSQVVECEHRFGIARESFGSRELHRIELRPDTHRGFNFLTKAVESANSLVCQRAKILINRRKLTIDRRSQPRHSHAPRTSDSKETDAHAHRAYPPAPAPSAPVAPNQPCAPSPAASVSPTPS